MAEFFQNFKVQDKLGKIWGEEMNKIWKEKGKIIANIGTKAQTTDTPVVPCKVDDYLLTWHLSLKLLKCLKLLSSTCSML